MFNGMMLAGRPRVNLSITISSNQSNWNLITSGFGGVAPTVPVSVQITVASAVVVTSMDLTGLPDGSSIALINNGFIYGSGGNGGKGQGVFMEADF